MTEPWPTENPNEGPLWVQWNRFLNLSPYYNIHALWRISKDGVRVLLCQLNDDQAEQIARQLGQPLPERKIAVMVPIERARLAVDWGEGSWWVGACREALAKENQDGSS